MEGGDGSGDLQSPALLKDGEQLPGETLHGVSLICPWSCEDPNYIPWFIKLDSVLHVKQQEVNVSAHQTWSKAHLGLDSACGLRTGKHHWAHASFHPMGDSASLWKDLLTPCFGFGFSQEMDILEPRNYMGRHRPNGKDRSSLNQRVPKEPLLSRGDGC